MRSSRRETLWPEKISILRACIYLVESNLVKVVCDQCINTNTQVVVHEDGGGWKANTEMSLGNNFYLPSIQIYCFGIFLNIM